MKFGVELEHTVSSLPNEERVVSLLYEKKGWREIGQTICFILKSYKCAAKFELESIKMEELKDWNDFLKAVLDVFPPNAGQKAEFVVRLFETLINSEVVQINK